MNNATKAKTHSHTQPFMGTKLQPKQGIVAGLFAGAGMMAAWLAAAQWWGPGARTLLCSIGGIVIPNASAITMLVGVVIHLIVASALGLLFAASMDRLDAKDTIIVSVFYGFTIWIVSTIILRHWIHIDAVRSSRSWWGLLVFLFFGFLLGVYANKFGQMPPDK